MEERENRWVEILKLENLLKENTLLNERLFLLESEKMEMGIQKENFKINPFVVL